jgi:hypothetical protein
VSLFAAVAVLGAVCVAAGVWGASSQRLLEPITGLNVLIFLGSGVGAPILLSMGQSVGAIPTAVVVAALGWARFAVGYRLRWGAGLASSFPVPVADELQLAS